MITGGKIRAAVILVAFTVLTLPLMPVQWLLVKISPAMARQLPYWYHRVLCKLLDVRLHVSGDDIHRGAPVLIVANHASWLDIPVLSAIAPVSFVAKQEVGNWPGAGTLARLQRTVFVNRHRRTTVGATSGEIAARLNARDNVVLFAEGTSSDGNRILPFRSSLFSAVKPSGKATIEVIEPADVEPVVQVVTVVYTKVHGLSMTPRERSDVTWYGDMDLLAHIWQMLQIGPIDVEIHVGTPHLLSSVPDRKTLADLSERDMRIAFVRMINAAGDRYVEPTAGPTRTRFIMPPSNAKPGRYWV